MEIQLKPTGNICFINGATTRIWEGHTAKGIKIYAYVARICVQEGEDITEFEAELHGDGSGPLEKENLS